MEALPPIVPVILSGGSGTRLWPLSRPSKPKQLLAMVDARTMLRATIDRLEGLPVTAPWVVCNRDHGPLVSRELVAAGLPPDRMLLEPVGRNTAPAAAAAALEISSATPDALMLVLPADHVIADTAAFQAAVIPAARAAVQGALATFGILPGYPETGYGYIAAGANADTGGARVVDRFVEKPDLETATEYVAGGNHLWNSGMFLFSATAYLDELRSHAPDILEAAQAALAAAARTGGIALEEAAFSACPSDSIDYAVMEHTSRAVVIPLDAGWSDVGSWAALWELAGGDASGNVVVGDVVARDVTGSYLRADSRLLAATGIEDLVVVETADAVLVTSRSRSQDVKALVDELFAAGRREAATAPRITTEWGCSELVADSPEFRLRVLTIDATADAVLPPDPGVRIWIAAAGSGSVEFGGKVVDISQGSATIPPGVGAVVRRSSDTALVVVEVTRTAES